MKKDSWLIISSVLLLAQAVPAAETLTVAPCGFDPAISQQSYSGIVQLTVNGIVVFVPGTPDSTHDGFYKIIGDEITAGPAQFRFARASESTCTCGLECENNFPVADLLIGPYPDFNPENIYTVLLDLGESPDRLVFGIRDCGCFDNSGELTVIIEAVPPNADDDGILDLTEFPTCLNTEPNTVVNPLGCGVDQICPCAQPLGRMQWNEHNEYVGCIRRASEEFLTLNLMSKPEQRASVKLARDSVCGGD